MTIESAIIERVETFVRHPVFTRSDEVMEDVLQDLETKVGREITPETFRHLRTLILQSPHLVGRN